MRSVGSRRVVDNVQAAPATSGSNGAGVSQTGVAYAPGMVVEHAKFGRGRILEVEDITTDLKISVMFDDPSVGRKSLLARYAKLKILS